MARVEVYKQKSIKKRWIFIGFIFSFLLIVSSILLLLYPFASAERQTYFSGEHPIVFKGVQAGNAIVEGDSVYLPYDFLKEELDDSIIFDEQSNSVIITTIDKVVQMPSESLTYFVNEEPVSLRFSAFKKDDNGVMYIALEPLMNYYSIEYSILPKTGAVWIKKDGQNFTHGEVADRDIHEEKLRLRTDSSLQSPYTESVNPNEKIYIESKKEDYYFVRKENGIAGFLHQDLVEKGGSETVVITREEPQLPAPQIEGPIQLTWEAVYTKNPDTSKIPLMPGVNVVSPTWFELQTEQGDISNLGSLEYVEWAKKQGYQVWALFSNGFDPELTHLALKDFETRQKIIRQLLHYSQMYQLDGINIDIENVNPEDGPFVTQFMREATPYFHEAGLVVSMDITFIAGGNWSAFYEREKLAGIVNYLIVMAYDEHWGSSPVAGSVASFPWVEDNLRKLLEIVPNEKLVLGVPLYTRLWSVKDTGEVSSQALSMNEVREWLKRNNVTPIYDDSSGQNYAEVYVEAEQTTYKVWLEDELSLGKRVELAYEYELAGVATWSRYFANDTAWTALNMSNQQFTKK